MNLNISDKKINELVKQILEDLLEPIDIYHGMSSSKSDAYMMFSVKINPTMLTGIGGLIKYWEWDEFNKDRLIVYNGRKVLDNKTFIKWVYQLRDGNKEEE